jgi:hypothetical protein
MKTHRILILIFVAIGCLGSLQAFNPLAPLHKLYFRYEFARDHKDCSHAHNPEKLEPVSESLQTLMQEAYRALQVPTKDQLACKRLPADCKYIARDAIKRNGRRIKSIATPLGILFCEETMQKNSDEYKRFTAYHEGGHIKHNDQGRYTNALLFWKSMVGVTGYGCARSFATTLFDKTIPLKQSIPQLRNSFIGYLGIGFCIYKAKTIHLTNQHLTLERRADITAAYAFKCATCVSNIEARMLTYGRCPKSTFDSIARELEANGHYCTTHKKA